MKYVKGLSEAEQRTLLDASRYAPWPRFRQRAHAVLLNGKGYRLAQLADIFEVDRDTVSGWLKAWKRHGLLGLRDQEHPGRPRKGTEEDREWLCETIKDAPHQLTGTVRAIQGADGVRPVTGHGAALAERKGLAMETLPPQFERKARPCGIFRGKAGIGRLS
jgi:transposase